MFANK